VNYPFKVQLKCVLVEHKVLKVVDTGAIFHKRKLSQRLPV